jgi:PAS domain S-box-containing protein
MDIVKKGNKKLVREKDTIKNIATAIGQNLVLDKVNENQASFQPNDIILSILDLITEHVVFQDYYGKIIMANQAAAQSAQMEPEQLIGKYCYKIWHGTNKRCTDCPIAISIKTEQPALNKIISPDGRIWFIKSSPVKDKNNKILGFVEISQDITEQVRAEEAVTLFQRRNEAFLTAIPDLMIVMDKNGICVDIQSNSEEKFKIERNNLIGKNLGDYLELDLKEKLQNSIKKVLASETTQTDNYQIINKGQTYYYEARFVPYPNEHVFAIVRDTTSQKLAEKENLENKKRFSDVANILPLTLFETDENLKITFVNKSGYNITGYTQEDINNGITILDIIAPECHELLKNNINGVINREDVYPNEYAIINKDSSKSYVLIYSLPIMKNREFKGFRGTIVDISERKKMENDLIFAKEKAEESDKLKSSFLANMSHEIRTPLNGILGFSELLKDNGLSKDEQDSYIDIINKKGKHLLNIISDIIDISRIESNQIKLIKEHFCLNDLMEEMIKSFCNEKIDKGKKHLEIRYKKENAKRKTCITTDKYRLSQIIQNLVSNALKYTLKGYIEIDWKLKNKNMLEFYVKDTGIGIPQEKQQLIFERFRQADDGYTRSFGGTGLGLSISKKLANILGGKIQVESHVKKGSVFSFSIPVDEKNRNEKSENEEQSENSKTYNWRGQTILIVEDDYSSFLFLKAVIKKTNAEIIHAIDGAKAIEICKSNDIDLVLMDIQLPKMDGYTATKKIKNFRKNLPIIAQTAHVLEEDRAKSLKAGCDDYISKPIDKNKLLKVLNKYLH